MPSVSSSQRGSVTFTSLSGTAPTQVITSVDITRSIVMFTERNADSQGRDLRYHFTAYLSDATHIQFTRNDAAGDTCVLAWEVVEFAAGALQSLQTGTIDPAATPTNIVITAVAAAQAFPILTCSTNLTSNTGGWPRPIISSTQLQLAFPAAPAAGNALTRWQVVEFKTADATVQSGTIALPSAYSATAAITAVNTGKTVVAGFGNGGAGGDRSNWQTYLSTSSQITTADQVVGSVGAANVTYYAIEMKDGSTVQSGNVAIAAAATAPASAPTWTAMTNGVMFRATPLANAVLGNLVDGLPLDVAFSEEMNAGQDGVAISRTGITSSVSLTYYGIDWAASGGGGTIWNVTQTEVANAVETLIASIVTAATQAETGAALDSATATAGATGTQSETGAALDTPSATLVASATQSETGSALDTGSATNLATAAQAETGSAADSPSATAAMVATQAETGAALDTQSTGAIPQSATQSETGAALDTPSATASMGATQAETATALDSSNGARFATATQAETGSALDTANASSLFAATQAETGSALDTVSASGVFYAYIMEAGGAADITASANIYIASMTETAAAIDVLTVVGLLSANPIDTYIGAGRYYKYLATGRAFNYKPKG
jgi:hypothetical protein